GRGLEDELQLLAVLGADTVRTARPAGLIEQLVGLLDVELPLRVLRHKARRVVDEVAGGDPSAPVDVRLHRGAVDEQRNRLADSWVAEQRVLRFDTGALAVDFGPGVGLVQLNVLDRPSREDL